MRGYIGETLSNGAKLQPKCFLPYSKSRESLAQRRFDQADTARDVSECIMEQLGVRLRHRYDRTKSGRLTREHILNADEIKKLHEDQSQTQLLHADSDHLHVAGMDLERFLRVICHGEDIDFSNWRAHFDGSRRQGCLERFFVEPFELSGIVAGVKKRRKQSIIETWYA
jgi:hypothetical protein